MVTKDGVVKILDFGLAKLLKGAAGGHVQSPDGAGDARRDGPGHGRLHVARAGEREVVDFRSDQFALGSILYEMATGKRAFQRGTSAETLTAIIREEPEPIPQLNAAVPAPFRWIVERCLQKDPEERYASTRDLARDIRGVREHLSDLSSEARSRRSVLHGAGRDGERSAWRLRCWQRWPGPTCSADASSARGPPRRASGS